MNLYYFISSLPMLKAGETPALSYAQFLEDCRTELTEQQFEGISRLSLDVDGAPCTLPFQVAHDWRDFETALRNAAARIRGARMHRTDVPAHPTECCSQHLQAAVENAFAIPSPAERERTFDSLRWQCLEDLDAKYYFTLENVAVYALKLQLLERIASRSLDGGLKGYSALVAAGIEQAQAVRVNSR